jgi:hypothetical protein
MLPPFDEYCILIAGLPNQFLSIQHSTLTAYRIGPFAAEVEGQVTFASGYVLTVWELLDLSSSVICSYSYVSSTRAATASGGMTPPSIPETRRCAAAILITSMSPRTSDVIAFLRRRSRSRAPIFPPSSPVWSIC